MTRIRLRSVSGKDVVAVPAIALGNEGVAAERGVVISERPRYLPTRAPAEDKHREAGREG